MMELKQKNSTVWVNVGTHLVVVSGKLEDCEWYGSKNVERTIPLNENSFVLILA